MLLEILYLVPHTRLSLLAKSKDNLQLKWPDEWIDTIDQWPYRLATISAAARGGERDPFGSRLGHVVHDCYVPVVLCPSAFNQSEAMHNNHHYRCHYETECEYSYSYLDCQTASINLYARKAGGILNANCQLATGKCISGRWARKWLGAVDSGEESGSVGTAMNH